MALVWINVGVMSDPSALHKMTGNYLILTTTRAGLDQSINTVAKLASISYSVSYKIVNFPLNSFLAYHVVDCHGSVHMID